jgi:hypothetical protein
MRIKKLVSTAETTMKNYQAEVWPSLSSFLPSPCALLCGVCAFLPHRDDHREHETDDFSTCLLSLMGTLLLCPHCTQVDKLNHIISEADAERFRQQREYDVVINERDILGTQLIRECARASRPPRPKRSMLLTGVCYCHRPRPAT